MEVASVLAFLASEVLAMVLTWRDAGLTDTLWKVVGAAAWPVVGLFVIASGLTAGMSLWVLCLGGASVTIAYVVGTGFKPAIAYLGFFYDGEASGVVDKIRWVSGFLCVMAAAIGASFYLISIGAM